VAEAVGHAAPVERSVVADVQLEGIAHPALGLTIRRHDVEVGADEADRSAARSLHREHEAGSLLVTRSGERLDRDEAAVDGRRERTSNDIRSETLLGDHPGVGSVLQLGAEGDQLAQQVDEAGLVQ
jgi:hypothetical protein